MGCIVGEPANIYRCKIGNYVRIGPFTEIQADAVIGDRTVVSSHCFIAAGTRIGSDCFIGHGVVTCNDKHPIANNPHYKFQPPTIEDGASLGSGVILLPGVRIGAMAQIGAGCIVTSDVPPNTVRIQYNGKALERKKDESWQKELAETHKESP